MNSLFVLLVFSVLGIWGVSDGLGKLGEDPSSRDTSPAESASEPGAIVTPRLIFGIVCLAGALVQLLGLFGGQL